MGPFLTAITDLKPGQSLTFGQAANGSWYVRRTVVTNIINVEHFMRRGPTLIDAFHAAEIPVED